MNKETPQINGIVEGELRFLRAKDVVAILSISRQKLHRMRISGQFITPVSVGKCVAYRSDELLDWMNSRQRINHE
jgi:predicted DNA-binding transcriptional regulator AlpA